MGNIMTCKINADTSDGLKLESDTSGAVDVQSNGTTRMTVLANGNVGIGSTSPSNKLDIVSSTQFQGIELNNGSNIVAELVGFGSGNDAGGLKLRNGGSATAEILASGNSFLNGGELFLGTSTNTANTTLVVQANNGVNSGIGVQTDHTGSNAAMYFMNTNGIIGSIVTSGSATAFNTSSDYRLKENVTYTFDATTRLKQLKPARFNFIADADTTVDGFLAHEVSSIVPEAIVGTKDATKDVGTIKDADGKVVKENVIEAVKKVEQTWEKTATVPDYQGIDQSKLVPLLVKTIQELEARITALENE
jgi:hypothetical protein